MNSQELISALNQKIKLHTEVIKNDGLGLTKCSSCSKLIKNHEYTNGLIYAYRDIISLVAYHDEP